MNSLHYRMLHDYRELILSCKHLNKHVNLKLYPSKITNENLSHMELSKIVFFIVNALLNAMKANTKLTILLFILLR